jgi:hypothetical protein
MSLIRRARGYGRLEFAAKPPLDVIDRIFGIAPITHVKRAQSEGVRCTGPRHFGHSSEGNMRGMGRLAGSLSVRKIFGSLHQAFRGASKLFLVVGGTNAAPCGRIGCPLRA